MTSYLKENMKDVNKPYCMICGDLDKLTKIKMDIGYKYFCEFCLRC